MAKYFYGLDWESRTFGYVLYDPMPEVLATLLDVSSNLKEMGYISDFALEDIPGKINDKILLLKGFADLGAINIMVESILDFYSVSHLHKTSDAHI